MRLADLEATWLKILSENSWQLEGVPFEEAQGGMFLCPVCWEKAGKTAVGVHQVVCWFDGKDVPSDLDPKPGRWTPRGAGMEDLTLDPPSWTGARSVLLLGGCGAHFFVTGGEVHP